VQQINKLKVYLQARSFLKHLLYAEEIFTFKPRTKASINSVDHREQHHYAGQHRLVYLALDVDEKVDEEAIMSSKGLIFFVSDCSFLPSNKKIE
jgi:hypothetical protein